MPRKRKQQKPEGPAGTYLIDDGHEAVTIDDEYNRLDRDGNPTGMRIAARRLKKRLHRDPAAADELRAARAAREAEKEAERAELDDIAEHATGRRLGGN